MRAHNIYPAVNVDDVFMKRLKKSIEENTDETYTLFSPYDVPELCDLYGEEFEKKYLEHEERFLKHPELYNLNTKVVEVKKIARILVSMLTESGFPYWTFIDTINKANPYPELGKIRTGNLCQEVMLPANEFEIAVCNLGSLNLGRINGDLKLLEESTRVLARFLDNSIDITSYPHPDCYTTQMRQRANGLGVLGEAEYIACNKIHFGSQEHLEKIDEIYGLIDRVTREVSQELAEEKGSCQIPGIRNAYRLCIAPNTTTGLYASTTSGCEPVYKTAWVEHKGNIPNVTMTAPHINADNFEYYKSAFEIDQYALIDATARRQKYIDMSISFSLFFDANKSKGIDLIKQYIYAWEKGIKSLYYLRNVKVDNKIETPDIACVGCAN